MVVKRSEMVILFMGMSPQVVFSKPYLEGIPAFRQPPTNSTSDVPFQSVAGFLEIFGFVIFLAGLFGLLFGFSQKRK